MNCFFAQSIAISCVLTSGLLLTACKASESALDSMPQIKVLDDFYARIHAARIQGDVALATRLADTPDVRLTPYSDNRLACLALEVGDADTLAFFIARAQRGLPEYAEANFPCDVYDWALPPGREALVQVLRKAGISGYEDAVNRRVKNARYQIVDGRLNLDPEQREQMISHLPRPWIKYNQWPVESKSTSSTPTDSTMTTTAVPRLETLDIVSIGLAMEMYRQGEPWYLLQAQADANASILPPDDSPRWKTEESDRGVASLQREAQSLELALSGFLEEWPVPTLSIFPKLTEPYTPDPDYGDRYKNYVTKLRQPAGLHWTKILEGGPVIFSDTPEEAIEGAFDMFERYPDLPALLVYVNGDGTYGNGPRRSNHLTETKVSMVLARRERVEWLRPWAPYTAINEDNWPAFIEWEKQPPQPFKPTPFMPHPWTRDHFKQWDSHPTLAVLHRPTVAKLTDDQGAPLKRAEQDAAMAAAWKQAVAQASVQPARVFFDAGPSESGTGRLAAALAVNESKLDLIEARQAIDMSRRVGDTNAASPFAMLALATMAAWDTNTPSVVIPLRRKDEALMFMVTPPATRPANAGDPLKVRIAPMHTNE